MEELRSTEVLDKEILEDARKKAYKILQTADDALAAQNRDWEKKVKRSVNSIQKAYETRLKKTTEEIYARLPLDKRRLRSETAEKFLVKAMNDFLRGLNREALLSILINELSGRIKACINEKAFQEKPAFIVRYSGMSFSETEELLKKVPVSANAFFGSAYETEESGDLEFAEDTVVHEFPFIVISTQDLKITASVEEAASALMKDKRAELIAALLGQEALND